MFKQITSVILLLALLLNILNRFVIYADYYSNTAAYARNCENKALPQMHCNGKCQMMKKLKEQEKKDSELPARKIINDAVTMSRSFPATIGVISTGIKTHYRTFSENEVVNMPRAFFHPPGV